MFKEMSLVKLISEFTFSIPSVEFWTSYMKSAKIKEAPSPAPTPANDGDG